MKHIPTKPKKKANPLDILKGKDKKKKEKPVKKEVVQDGVGEVFTLPMQVEAVKAPPKLPTGVPRIPQPKDRETREIDAATPIITPTYCKAGGQKPQSRIRMGVSHSQQITSVLEGLEDPEGFLSNLIAKRLEYVSSTILRISIYPDCQPDRCNMPDSIVRACIGMMEKFDFTYGPITKVKDIVESAAGMGCLNSIDTMGGEDVISHAFCLVYLMFLLRVSRTKIAEMLKNENVQVRALAALFSRYVTPPTRLVTDLSRALTCSLPVCISDDDGEERTMPLSEFTERLLKPRANPDFLDTTFPPFSPEEELYVNSMIARYREEFKQRTERNKDKPKEEKPQLTDVERKIAKKAAKKKAEREAKEEMRNFKRKYQSRSTLLHGFADAGTQMSWVAFRANMNNETSEALAAEQERQRLRVQKELYEKALKDAEEEAKKPKEISEMEITQKPSKRAVKRAATEARQKAESEKQAKKAKKTTKLQQVSDAYLF
eukprot:TRINITY_DN24343_c0_g1_i1.p1 TRINITY_DN24343_c0_g1~~TRINITY_DN24343_c0_g1_i1.p1  ORF type:complete len:489 (+),score=138.24 TRINITY_DN24343_c0_g1_i1:58-1524(+)